MADGAADEIFGSLRVLVVDDALGMQEILEGYLEELGVGRIIVADGGAAALAKLGEIGGAVDLIITDVRMPNMSGYEFIRQIRAGGVPDCQDVPILILTGLYTDEDRKQARLHRIQGYILKPPTIDVLGAEIKHVLGIIS